MNETSAEPFKLTAPVALVRYQPGSLFQAIDNGCSGEPAVHIVGRSGVRALCPYPLVRDPRTLAPGAVATCKNCLAIDGERRQRRAQYEAYLRTPAWIDRRDRVMVRAEGWCEGCGLRPATEVHHLTYKHLFAEFLFELVALCEPCHRRVHPEGRP